MRFVEVRFIVGIDFRLLYSCNLSLGSLKLSFYTAVAYDNSVFSSIKDRGQVVGSSNYLDIAFVGFIAHAR